MTKSRIRSILALVLTLALCITGLAGMRNALAEGEGDAAGGTADALTLGAPTLTFNINSATVPAQTLTVSAGAAGSTYTYAVTGAAAASIAVTPAADTKSASVAVVNPETCALGDAVITVTESVTGATQNCTVTLKRNASVAISDATAELAPGATKQLTVTSVFPAGAAVAWSSDNAAVATVSSTGLISVAAGATNGQTATISANVAAGTGITTGAYANCVVTVRAATPPVVTPDVNMTASPTTITTAGGYSQISATITNPGTLYASGYTVSWAVTDKGATTSNVAQITSTGTSSGYTHLAYIQARVSGTAVVTVTVTAADGVNKIIKSIEVPVSLPNPTLSMVSDIQTLTSRSQYATVTATLTNANTATPANSAVTWRSDDKKVATIKSAQTALVNGVATAHVHAVNNGTVRIYCKTASGVETYHTVYVSGLVFLPQTGQNMTWVYVLGAACVALLAAAGIVNARRKKQHAE